MYKITFSILLLIGTLFFGCGKETPAPAPKVMPDRVVMNVSDSAMAIRSVNTLEAWVLPENADDKTLLWSSSDPSVVSVDASGRIEAMKEGTAFITATARLGGISSTRQVTVERDDQRLMGWIEYITIPNYSFMAMEVFVANASNTPFTIKNIEMYHGTQLLVSYPSDSLNRNIPAQSSHHVYTHDSYSSYLFEYHVKVYFTMNNRNYAMTVYNGSWKIEPVNGFSIDIDPEWSDDDTTVELPTP